MPNDNQNVIAPLPEGPFRATGNIRIVTNEGDFVYQGSETYLCRCGQSNNKPFCDGSHDDAAFADPGTLAKVPRHAEQPTEGELTIILRPNGPLRMDGPYVLEGADGTVSEPADKGSLCRCGESTAKPMCDGAHKECDFEA